MRGREQLEVLRHGREELRCERRTRAELAQHQHDQLRSLLEHARSCSPFHRRRVTERDARDVELAQLAAMTKRDLSESFEEIVTDRRLTSQVVERHVSEMAGADPLLFGEYRVLGSGGTSGVSTYVPYDRSSWLWVQAPNVRLAKSYGFSPRVMPRYRLARLTAGGPLHMTNRMAASNRSSAYATVRLDVAAPIPVLDRALTEFRPDVLIGYPSVIAALAEEQRAGRLSIEPRWILCGSEQLLPAARSAMQAAWGVSPYDVYATTETGGVLAYECPERRGMHIREETCIAEVVDEENQPLPDGAPGVGLLVTSWLNRTVPLIRYLIDDPVTVTDELCGCGRSSRRIVKLAGRIEDSVTLAGLDGSDVTIHPNQFEEAIEERPEIARYQVLHRPDAITISAVPRDAGAPTEWTRELEDGLVGRLRALGADPPLIRTRLVQELERAETVGAKLKVVRSEGAGDSHA